MEEIAMTFDDGQFRIADYPHAVKVIRLDGARGRQIADVLMHRADFAFALDCLNSINSLPEEPRVVRESVWRSAVIHFLKCFQHSHARKKLDANVVYKGLPEAITAYKYFANLRDKHFVHDENLYAQCQPGAILNARGAEYKIEKVIGVVVIAQTLEQANYSNLHKSLTHALEWIRAEFDKLCDLVTIELEGIAYDDLLAREALSFTSPTLSDLGNTRPLP